MTAMTAVSDEAGAGRGVHSIGAVARMLDVPAATIRNWEERHSRIVPERSAGGHRSVLPRPGGATPLCRGADFAWTQVADAHRLLAEQGESGQPVMSDGPGVGGGSVLLAERDPWRRLRGILLRTDEGYDVSSASRSARPRSTGSTAAPARDRGADDLRRSRRGAVSAPQAAP